MVKVPVHNIQGEVVDNVELSEEVFGIEPNLPVVHQALVAQQANARQGTASTKTRGQVAGGGRKPFRQKGTGRARRGSQSSPLLRGGGIIFGPKPRCYRQALPKKMRHLAMRSVLSAKVSDGEIRIVDQLVLDEPRTKDIVRMKEALGIDNTVLIITEEASTNVYKSVRNLKCAKALPANMINVGDMLDCRMLLLTRKSVPIIEDMLKPRPSKLVEA